MNKNIRCIVPLILFLAIVAAIVYYLNGVAKNEGGPLTASGTVEAVEITIAPEVGGRVTQVLVSEGEVVNEGDALFELDTDLMEAQREGALAALETAQANLEVAQASQKTAQAAVEAAQIQYQIALNTARSADNPNRTVAWQGDTPDEFTLPVWYFQKSEDLAAAETEIRAAETALDAEHANFEHVIANASNVDLVAAETRLSEAQAAFLVAEDVLERAKAQKDEKVTDFAQSLFDTAKVELDAAQLAYDQILSKQSADDVLEARARLVVAQERYDTALDHWNRLLTGDESLQVEAAATTLHQAEANAAQIDATISQAEKVIAQAQAELDLLDVQMEKLVVRAPVTGVVLSRNVEPGEVVKPGGVAMTLGQLDDLSITVYVPEDRYGEISLDDQVVVTVDSFPSEIFSATVVRIADQAEYTPRNVQTTEGRRSTVFAVELAVNDPAGKLKPGMPADVEFGD